MLDTDEQDSLTTLNTALNKSMVLMESPVENTGKRKRAKSIKINTKAQPPSSQGSTPDVVGRSILKKSKIHNNEHSDGEDSRIVMTEENVSSTKESSTPLPVSSRNPMPRPRNLKDFLERDDIVEGTTRSTFNLEELSDSEELWVMNVPKTVNPRTLRGQTLLLGDKSKLKIGDGRYCAVNRDMASCLTCVFGTGKDIKPYRTVNIKPAGSVAVRRKLPGIMKRTPDNHDSLTVPFPQNVKIRHPFFGPTRNKGRST